MRRLTTYLGFFAFCAAAAGASAMGSAEVIQIAAPGFVPHATNTTSANPGEVFQGLLLNASGFYYAPVVFPGGGQVVCQFKLVYRDFDADFDITARLLRKVINIGGSAFDPPVVMAS